MDLRRRRWPRPVDRPSSPTPRKRIGADAEAALAEPVGALRKGTAAHDEQQTVATCLRQWLATGIDSVEFRPTTAASYRLHADQLFVPALGHQRLRDLRPGHIQAIFGDLAEPRPGQWPRGAASLRRVHATLRGALGAAMKARLIAHNPAVDVRALPKAARRRVQPWEPAELGIFSTLPLATR